MYWTVWHQVVISSTPEMGTDSVSESSDRFSTLMHMSAEEDFNQILLPQNFETRKC